MNAATLGAVGTLVAIATAIFSAFLLARSNTRDNVRMRQEERDKAVADARAPLIADNAQLSGTVAQLRLEVQRKDDRIQFLEDALYNRGGPAK